MDAVGEVDLLRFQPFHRLTAHGGGVSLRDKGDGNADACHILGDIACNTAMNKADVTRIGAGGMVFPRRESLDIDKYDAHDNGGRLAVFLLGGVE